MSSGRTLDKKEILAGHWLLAEFSAAQLEILARHARLATHKANQVIFRKDDPGNSLMAIVHGRVKITSTSYEGKEVVLNIIDAGELFGEIALLDGRPRTADASTMIDTELLVLERRDFIPVIQRNPEVCVRLIAVLCERLRRTSSQVEDLLFLDQPGRLAKTLLRLIREFGEAAGGGARMDMRLTQRELGAIVGMSREEINRQLARLRDTGLINVDHGRIVVPDVAAFERYAQGAD